MHSCSQVFRTLLLAGLSGCLGSSVAHAGEWMKLFDERDLDGFTVLNGTADFRVENREIVGTYKGGTPNTFLATNQDLGDFILEFEFKADAGVNSGVQFRSASSPDYQNGRVHGYQYEIDTSERAWTGGIYDEARSGWIATSDTTPGARDLYKHEQWNKARIECIGNDLRTFLNGEPVAHVIDDQSSEGFIAFQVHSIGEGYGAEGKEVRWRNIRVMVDDLEPTPPDDVFIVNAIPNSLSEAEDAQGVELLFDGKTTKGWRGAHKEHFPSHGWVIRDGELIVQPADGGESTNGGDIVTLDEYSAFDLSLEVKFTPGANSGIKYFVTEGYLKGGEQRSAIGLEYQILDDARHPDAKMGRDGNRTLASLYDLMPSARQVHGRTVPRDPDRWHRVRLVVNPDNTVRHYLDGYLVLEYTRGSSEYDDLVARSKYKNWDNFGMAEKGHILLQDHGDEVHFRSVKIRELD